MIDLETMSTQSYAAIISIGAVKFDLNTGKIGDTFYRNIDLQSALDSGLLVNSASISWWMNQNKKAIRDLQNDKVELYSALLDFVKFCSGDYYVWGNSAKFDLGILQNAYDKVNIPMPWNFKKELDLRTLVFFNQKIKNSWKFKGTKHNALDDCKNQIGYCCKIYKHLTLTN